MESIKNSNKDRYKKELNVYEQRFLMLMKLIKIDRMLKKAIIVHSEHKSKE